MSFLFDCKEFLALLTSWHGCSHFRYAIVSGAGVVFFQDQFLTVSLLHFQWGEVLFKSGVVFALIR